MEQFATLQRCIIDSASINCFKNGWTVGTYMSYTHEILRELTGPPRLNVLRIRLQSRCSCTWYVTPIALLC